jgi:hypothetical protein
MRSSKSLGIQIILAYRAEKVLNGPPDWHHGCGDPESGAFKRFCQQFYINGAHIMHGVFFMSDKAPVRCTHCGSVMESIGKKDFRTGPINEVVSLAFYPELGTPVPLETYVCRDAGSSISSPTSYQ